MKKGKKKLFIIFSLFVFLLLVMTIFATAEEEIKILSENAKNYVSDFVEKRGINSENIKNITEVNFDDLPKEVNIENVDDTNLAIYQIDYDEVTEEEDKVFVITYSVEKLKSQGDIIIAQDKREFLNFGFGGEMTNSRFLETASGVETGLDKGYVMMREGSITGISTSLEILEGTGDLEIVIYKNGEKIQFGNTFVVGSAGVKKDYDVQSRGVVSFEPGDVISVYVKASDGIIWKDVVNLIEITTTN